MRKSPAYIFNDSFLGTDNVTIFQLMLCKVNFGNRPFLLNLMNSPLELSFGVGHDGVEICWMQNGRKGNHKSKLQSSGTRKYKSAQGYCCTLVLVILLAQAVSDVSYYAL